MEEYNDQIDEEVNESEDSESNCEIHKNSRSLTNESDL